MTKRLRWMVVVFAVFGLVAASCGDDEGDDGTAAAQADAEAAATAAEAEAAAAQADAEAAQAEA
ncbi:MAG: hypothetical protein OXL98_10100, partial [Acidimicrobiaceae bacterium]|nr:hypothetical protein [Acidimicrobiaceae bacterium]